MTSSLETGRSIYSASSYNMTTSNRRSGGDSSRVTASQVFVSSSSRYTLLSVKDKERKEGRMRELDILISSAHTPDGQKLRYRLERESLMRKVYESTAGYAKKSLQKTVKENSSLLSKVTKLEKALKTMRKEHETEQSQHRKTKRSLEDSQKETQLTKKACSASSHLAKEKLAKVEKTLSSIKFLVNSSLAPEGE